MQSYSSSTSYKKEIRLKVALVANNVYVSWYIIPYVDDTNITEKNRYNCRKSLILENNKQLSLDLNEEDREYLNTTHMDRNINTISGSNSKFEAEQGYDGDLLGQAPWIFHYCSIRENASPSGN